MGVILIILVIYLIFHKKDDKKKCHKSYNGKSDWEKTCDDGGKFFGW